MASEQSEKRKAVNNLKTTVTEATNKICLRFTDFKIAHRNRDNDTDKIDSIETEVYEQGIAALNEQKGVLDEIINELQANCIESFKRKTVGRNKDLTKDKNTTGDSGVYSTDSSFIAEESANDERKEEDCTNLKGIVANPTHDATGTVTLSLRDVTLSTGKRHPQENWQDLDSLLEDK